MNASQDWMIVSRVGANASTLRVPTSVDAMRVSPVMGSSVTVGISGIEFVFYNDIV